MTIIIEYYSVKLSCPAAKIVIEDMGDEAFLTIGVEILEITEIKYDSW